MSFSRGLTGEDNFIVPHVYDPSDPLYPFTIPPYSKIRGKE